MTSSPRSKRRRLAVIDPPLLSELLPDESLDDETSEVTRLLKEAGFKNDIISTFKRNKIMPHDLFKMTHSSLTEMGISAMGDQKKLLHWIHLIPEKDAKVFNDPVHGHFELHPLLVAIIDTCQFQRLRYIKQLGGGYYVFPGASHNRFEHSLGVCHLAGEFVESLQRRQADLCISSSDILCVKVAGLCHDLGHGPFSHMFDMHFIPKVPEMREWKHEDGSVDMLDHLINENNLWTIFKKYGLSEQDLVFIKELIVGSLKHVRDEQEWPYEGRPIEKSFLYEIVANKKNGVDVDKWDYFARDCYCLGIPNSFDCKRYMKFARVIEVNGKKQICCRDKEVVNLYEMFHTRIVLHRRAYQHKTSQAVEIMLTEALLAANDHFKILGRNGALVRMSDAIDDMVAYTNLTDAVIQMIMMSTDTKLKEAQSLLRQVEERQLYKCIGQTQPSIDINDKEENIKREIINSAPTSSFALTMSDLHVRIVKFDYGMGKENPIDKMRFYIKNNPNKAVKVRKDQVSQMLPRTFLEKNIRVYCKKLDKPSLDLAHKCFVNWCNKQNHLMTPKGECSFSDSEDEQEFTPYGTPFGTPIKDETATSSNADDNTRKKLFN